MNYMIFGEKCMMHLTNKFILFLMIFQCLLTAKNIKLDNIVSQKEIITEMKKDIKNAQRTLLSRFTYCHNIENKHIVHYNKFKKIKLALLYLKSINYNKCIEKEKANYVYRYITLISYKSFIGLNPTKDIHKINKFYSISFEHKILFKKLPQEIRDKALKLVGNHPFKLTE